MAMKYRITYDSEAERVRNTLPRAGQIALTALLQQLGSDPFAIGTYNRSRKEYTAGLSDITVAYVVHGHIVTVSRGTWARRWR